MITTPARPSRSKASSPAPVRRKQQPPSAVSGIVNFCVRGRRPRRAGRRFTTTELITALRGGLPVGELEALRTALAVPMDRLAPILGISKATLHRRKLAGRLAPAESDRVLRLARLMGKAVEVMESEENARAWLGSPQFGLGGCLPLEYAESEVGAREVEDLLGRIEHGVYS